MSVQPTLSKSQFMEDLKKSAAWQFVNAKQNQSTEKKESQASIQARREMGDKIGVMAQDYFEGGVEVPEQFEDIKLAQEQTNDLISAGEETLFEATAIHPENGSFARIDVLKKDPESGEWDMIEVKSSTKAKPEHIEDLAFQRYVFEAAGYKIRKSEVMHLNTDYVSGTEVDVQEFFKMTDVTDKVVKKQPWVESKATEFVANKTGKEVVNIPALTEFLNDIEYPVYFLDYETVMNAIPLYEGTRPYQQVPFQYSVHVLNAPDDEVIEHRSFIHTETSDPRRAFAEKLIEDCGANGSVVVYFQNFEESRNKELARDFPDLADGINAISARMVDIFKPFQQRWLYNPAQAGSASLKVVLPTFTDISYADMEIGNGEQALNEYLAFATGFKTDPDELEALWKALDVYCEQDTYAMVELLDVLYQKSGYDTRLKLSHDINKDHALSQE